MPAQSNVESIVDSLQDYFVWQEVDPGILRQRRTESPNAAPSRKSCKSGLGPPAHGRRETRRPLGSCRGGVATSPCRRYFFFAAFILLGPQEDLLLFVVFFDMHAIAVPPLRKW